MFLSSDEWAPPSEDGEDEDAAGDSAESSYHHTLAKCVLCCSHLTYTRVLQERGTDLRLSVCYWYTSRKLCNQLTCATASLLHRNVQESFVMIQQALVDDSWPLCYRLQLPSLLAAILSTAPSGSELEREREREREKTMVCVCTREFVLPLICCQAKSMALFLSGLQVSGGFKCRVQIRMDQCSS